MENLNSFFDEDVKFAIFDGVIIDIANVRGTVVGLEIDTDAREILYRVAFDYGSVWVPNNPEEDRGTYDVSEALFIGEVLRKC